MLTIIKFTFVPNPVLLVTNTVQLLSMATRQRPDHQCQYKNNKNPKCHVSTCVKNT